MLLGYKWKMPKAVKELRLILNILVKKMTASDFQKSNT